ncbi:MAG: 2-hydroxyacyl-CoA dehydratase [Firmicutes bacterium]|nr:2-hydroxyacyl-CoA dehydratase [Bacillota bacterium]
MDLFKKYSDMIKEQSEKNPERARLMVRLGLTLKNFQESSFGTKGLPAPYEKLFVSSVNSIRRALARPERSVWTNIFGPVEIFQCLDLQGISVEALSTFLTGFHIEDYLIDTAEAAGIAPTLCSYHRSFLGGLLSGLLPTPLYSVTTSTVCDGNLSTFRFASDMRSTGLKVLDVPHSYSPEGEKYLADQLREMTAGLEEAAQCQLKMDDFREVIRRENESRGYYREFLEASKEICYPNTLTLNTCMLFATHLNIGTEETLTFFREMAEDIKNYGPYTGSRILWVHLQPIYDEVMKEIFNLSYENNIQLYDFNLDYMEDMDEEHPFEALARKMICNQYNGDFSRKRRFLEDCMDEYRPDGVIHYCHWGCKQSAGGVSYLKKAAAERGIPMLILDGDAIDRRNTPEGQIKTRTEAFLEMLKNRRRA